MTFAIDKWKKNGWKIAFVSAVGLIIIKLIIWPLLQSGYDKVRSAEKKGNGIAEWLPNLGPYWLVVLAAIALGGVLIWAGASKGEGAKRVKTIFELFLALARVVLLVAVIAFLTIFIVGPKVFWKGDYNYQPPQQATQTQTGRITTQAGHLVVRDTKRIDILAPIGTINTPTENWSEPLHIYGRSSQMDAFADDGTRREGVLAVNADGVIHIIGPGLDPDIGKPNVLRFLSLTNFPLRVSGRME